MLIKRGILNNLSRHPHICHFTRTLPAALVMAGPSPRWILLVAFSPLWTTAFLTPLDQVGLLMVP